jgi:hypothetical protein
MIAFANVALAAVSVKESGTDEGKVEYLDFDDGFTVTVDENEAEVDIDRTGDWLFQTYLYAMGRGNAASSLASSATNIDAWSVPYVFIRKSIGGDSGLDETDGGTRLPNGYDGQVIVFYIGSCMTDGSWIVTPVTRTGFDYITFDAVGETVTLLYVNDTIGWIIIANEGATVTGYNYGAGL